MHLRFILLLIVLWQSPTSADDVRVTVPPAELKVDPFHKKYIDAGGYPIVASEKVNDYALKEAAYLVDLMLAKRPDVRAAMIKSGSRLCIIAHNEFTTDVPEFAWLKPKDYWDARARGTGGSQTDPYCSCGEENLLAYPGDPYSTENILIHEFAHNIHLRGMVNVDPTFDRRLKETYDRAMTAELWKGKYAATNHHEYFAEGSSPGSTTTARTITTTITSTHATNCSSTTPAWRRCVAKSLARRSSFTRSRPHG